jgi:transcriptional regulator with XRE-family HTH domain
MGAHLLRYGREKLQRARERLGWSIEMVGEKAGTSKNSVLRAEHEGEIRPLTARKIAEALGVEVADLLLEEVETPDPKGQPSPQREGESRGRQEWKAEVEAFISEASEVIDDPDLAETTCLDISQTASDLWFEGLHLRDVARQDPNCSWKERNDLNLAFERISEFSTKAVDTFLDRFRQSVHVDEVKAKRDEVEQRKRTA